MNLPGFQLIRNVVADQYEWIVNIKRAMDTDAQTENLTQPKLRTRLLRYGYDYTNRKRWLGDPPMWSSLEAAKPYDSITINEYPAGHGIAPHIDSLYFGPRIAILSLGADAIMKFEAPDDTDVLETLPMGSLAILTCPLRLWKHSIVGESVKAERYSIVYRMRL